ncbi:MAG: bifunctional 3'-5' exonuclease/DNA polymerase, partial [Rothia dentocariosa]
MYILVVPLDAPTGGSVIPLDAHPARTHTGTSGYGSPSSPAFWGVFHVESLAPAQLTGTHTKLNILRADRVSTGNLPAYVREVERRSDPRINP